MKRAHNTRSFFYPLFTDLLYSIRWRYFTFHFITDTIHKKVIEKRKLIAIIFNEETQRNNEE